MKDNFSCPTSFESLAPPSITEAWNSTFGDENIALLGKFTVPEAVLVFGAVFIVFAIFIAVVGNFFTILAYIKDNSLHESLNIYILNLAIADFFVGLISMPVYLVYTLNNNVWIFGHPVCKAYLFSDLVFTGVAVEFMILISYDRLMLVRKWSRKYKEETTRNAYIRSAVAWILAVVAFGPATLFWDTLTGENSVYSTKGCQVKYAHNSIYIGVLSLMAFPVPFLTLCVLNTMIIYSIRKKLIKSEQLSNPQSHESVTPSHTSTAPSRASSIQPTPQMSRESSGKERTYFSHLNLHLGHFFHLRAGRKAARSLATLIFVFGITWAPYTVAKFIRSLCDSCVSVPLYESFVWILWLKSAINPFLYAYNCNRFRENFRHFLCLDRKNPLFNP